MNRAALRLATIAALTNGGAEPWPTMAGARVFDSRQDPVDMTGAQAMMPVIVVHSESDRQSRSLNGIAVSRTVDRRLDLRIEIALTPRAFDEAGVPLSLWPVVDADLEAMLDLFEYQVEVALFGAGPWALWWRGLAAVTDTASSRYVIEIEQQNLRFAAREIVLAASIPGECHPKAVIAGQTVPATALPAGFAEVADKIIADGSGQLVANVTRLVASLNARTLPAPVVYPRFAGGTVTIADMDEPLSAEFDT